MLVSWHGRATRAPVLKALVMLGDSSEPDYASYSYEELEGVYRYVDREKYPERFKIVEELLKTRTKEIEPELVSSEEKKYLHAFFVGELLIWAIIFVLGVLGYIVL